MAIDLKTPDTGRLAFRVEGKWWMAYYAQPDSMDGAILLGCIHMICAENNQLVKRQFIEMMKQAIAELIEKTTGKEVSNWRERTAPEHERAGTA